MYDLKDDALHKGSTVDHALGYVLSAAEARRDQWQVMANAGEHESVDPFDDLVPELFESGLDERIGIVDSLTDAIQTVIDWRKRMLGSTEEAKRGYHYALVPHEIHVTGRGEFPLDMLRRDRCFPLDEGEAQRIQFLCMGAGPNGEGCANNDDEVDGWKIKTVVRLGTMQRRLWMPTVMRWKSFGWTVVEHKVGD